MRERGLLAGVLTVLLSLVLVGCSQSRAATGPITFKDDAGRTVTLAKPAVRIVTLGPSDTETVLALHLKKDLVGADADSFTYLPQSYRAELKGVPDVGPSVENVDVEKIAARHPSLVLAAYNAPYVQKLTSLGIKVAILDPTSIAGILKDISRVGQATGDSQGAAAVNARLKDEIQAVKKAVAGKPRPSVFVELDPTLYTVGPGSFMDGLIAVAGGQNAMDGSVKTAYPQVSSEAVIAADPDVIVLQDQGFGGSAAADAARPGWSDITAVKDHRIVSSVSPDLFSNPGPAVGEGLLELARALHPGLVVKGF